MGSSSPTSSLLLSVLPLIGVVIGSLTTLLVTVVGTMQKNRREEYVLRRQKIERLYVCIHQVGEAYRDISIDLLDKAMAGRLNELEKDYLMNMRKSDALRELTVEAKMIVDIHFPSLDNVLQELNATIAKLHPDIINVIDYVRQNENLKKPDEYLDEILRRMNTLTNELREKIRKATRIIASKAPELIAERRRRRIAA